MLRLYRRLLNVSDSGHASLESHAAAICPEVFSVSLEWCFYVQASSRLDTAKLKILTWLLGETFDPAGLGRQSFLSWHPTVIEIGPRLNFETAWSSAAVSICHDNGLTQITRLERSLRIGLDARLTPEQVQAFAKPLHDRMTQTLYPQPLTSFYAGIEPAEVVVIPVLEEGMTALERVNVELGLAMDRADLDRFYDLFANQLGRNPTDVELFQLGQGNSEHSRHGFFKGRLVVDGKDTGTSLMAIVKAPWQANPGNSLIAFKDDSSAIRGGDIRTLVPTSVSEPGPLELATVTYHPTLTAETHNFPCSVAPYPGAATGTGGRIRDNQCVGRGGLVIASGAAYCVGNLPLDGLPPVDVAHPPNLASPLDILIQASNGASDYGNCFGEPLIYGFVRSFSQKVDGEYRSWFKPVMYTVGAGQIDDRHTDKGDPQPGMLVVQIGGPAYRIGLGGGAASSMVAGDNTAELDFNAVQRGNPEMEQRVNRVFRACIELGDSNPIVSAHDLGAGGDSNALPELVYPAGATIDVRAIPVGDTTLSILEIWGNESQERNAVLVKPADIETLLTIGQREGAPIAIVGTVRSDGRLVLHDERSNSQPVDLPLEPILGDTPPKDVQLETVPVNLQPLELDDLDLAEAVERVLRLPSVGSKAYLTRKVDRCVTGLVAQQQCVGPNHLPLSDYAAVAQSLFDVKGAALSLGEQPIKGLINPAAMARLAVAEALLNLSGAKVTGLGDIKWEANWMWAAKLPGEGARLYQAACALHDILIALATAIDGGKDSLSMAVRHPEEGTVKAPGELVMATYAPMPDVRRKVTPDLKRRQGKLLLLDLSAGQQRLGGSALAQAYGQLGNDCPDVDDVDLLRRTFEAVQELVERQLIVAAHDKSDGGLIVTLLEMAFGGNFGLNIELTGEPDRAVEALFNEEPGLVVEVAKYKLPDVEAVLEKHDLTHAASLLGEVGQQNGAVRLSFNGGTLLTKPMVRLRELWEETSFQMDRLQTNPACVDAEQKAVRNLTTPPPWQLSYWPKPTPDRLIQATDKPKVAVLREQGTNGDREMTGAFLAAGFEVWDVTMSDLLAGRVSLDSFRGIAFPGGFSFGDVLDAGKGWAAKILFNQKLSRQFSAFYERPDTFSLGVCNGAQLMALIGWVPWGDIPGAAQPRFIRNLSGRFECRLASVQILPTPAIMLQGMEGSCLGVWSAHKEGHLHIPNDGMLKAIVADGLAPLRFVDPGGQPTEQYPFNPNGSPQGITALCSPDGRHLAMMTHTERLAHALWQWPWLPDDWQRFEASPWLRLFQNAYQWCQDTTPRSAAHG